MAKLSRWIELISNTFVTRSFWLPLLISISLFPSLFVFYRFVMICEGWELRDPVAGITAISGGFRLARYELLHNANILWSPLKSFGVPLLSNDVQAAILYPLTLISLWVPEMYFWNFLVCLRIILIGMFSYLIATNCLRLKPFAAWIFTVSFAYSLYVLRWMNHPWQNGLLAGLVYLYYLIQLFETPSIHIKKWGKNTIGLLVGCYSLLTCGFPESSAMSALLICLVFTPIFLLKWKERALRASFFVGFALSHTLALMLASPAVFALVEGVLTTGNQYRKEYGQFQYSLSMLSVQLLTRFTEKMPDLQDPNFFNLIPTFLFLCGLSKDKKKLGWSVFEVSALLCMVFFILKLFPIWPGFNKLVGSLPILRQCWFIVYFMPIFLWGFAYFSARGAEKVFYHNDQGIKVEVVLSFFVVLLLFAKGILNTENLARFLVFKTAVVFILFSACVFYFVFRRPVKQSHLLILTIAGILSLLEVINTQPHTFRPFQTEKYYFWEQEKGKTISEILKENNISPFDVREDSAAGSFTAYGIATIDNGNPPILPYRLRRLRQRLFDAGSDQEGYSPLAKQRVPYAWQAIGKNLYLLGAPDLLALPQERAKSFSTLGLVDTRFLLRDKNAVDRAYIASNCSNSKDWDTSSDMIVVTQSFYPGKVIVEELDDKEKEFCRKYSKEFKNIGIKEDIGTSITLQPITGPSLLVLNDTYYPGWKVIDRATNQELKIHPANLAFRAVLLPEGRAYDLEFIYKPVWLFLSKILVVLGGGGLLLLYLFTHHKTNLFRRSESVKLAQ